jgi:hypothetical protein
VLLLSFFRELFEDAVQIGFAENQEVFTVNGDFRSGIFAKQDSVAYRNSECPARTIILKFAWANGKDFTLLGFLFGRVGNDDTSLLFFFEFDTSDDDIVVQWAQSHEPFSFLNVSCLFE